MYYFDNNLLKQYLDQKRTLKAYDGSNWYEIADQSDLSDTITCIGYDVYGKDHRFDYRDISQIQVGAQLYTLEMLQSFMAGKGGSEEEKPKGKSSDSEPPVDEEEPPKKEKEPDLSWFSPAYDIGKGIMQEARRRAKNAN
jgi:hypothetical protein